MLVTIFSASCRCVSGGAHVASVLLAQQLPLGLTRSGMRCLICSVSRDVRLYATYQGIGPTDQLAGPVDRDDAVRLLQERTRLQVEEQVDQAMPARTWADADQPVTVASEPKGWTVVRPCATDRCPRI